LSRIQIGRVVVLWLAVKRVTMISSKLSANASSPPAGSAVRSSGNVTRQMRLQAEFGPLLWLSMGSPEGRARSESDHAGIVAAG